jgi:nucleoside-diphosphate-sugar epimerase
MKILVAGALGYIGTGLIETYLNEHTYKVILVDKKYIPERLANLPTHFKYVQGNILDNKLLKPLLQDVDLAYLLAADVEAEKSVNKVESMWKNNYEANINFLKNCSNHTRIIFTSTGNVFGGVDEKVKYMNLNEEDVPKPKYPYAETKRAVEEYLLESNKNFTICRLGTNYGYTPGIRFNLVINNFIKKVLMEEDIVVHGTGENFRPTCSVYDVVRALRFLGSNEDAKGQIYHIVQENYRIKDLAEKIASHNPNVALKSIVKKVPFSSYHLSSNKIKKLGFVFKWDLDKVVKKMFEIFACINTSTANI